MEAKDPDRLNAALAVHCCLGDAAAVDALSDGVMVDDALERIYFDPSSTPALFKQPCGTMRGTSVRIALRKLLPHQRIPVIAAILGSFDAPKHLLVGGSWECNLMESVSGMQAQSILGIDDQPFRRLRDAGIIPTTRVPGSRSYFVELSVLDELLRLGIQSRTLHQSRRSLRAMRNTNHVAVYSGLRDGSVLSGGYKVGSGLRSLRVAFDRPASDRCPDPTLAEVAALAQVHYHYIQQLVKVGFLKAYKRKGNKFYIAAQDADSFINTYVFAGPLARSKGIHYPNFVRHLISSGHAPVSGPSIDGGRVYLFRRSDLLGGGPSDEHPTRLNTRTAASPRVDVTCMKLRDLCNELKISSPTGTGLLNRGFISEVHRIGGDVHISIESVERYREVLTSSEWIDLQDAADLANESIAGFRRRWVLSGLVEELDLMLVRRVRASDLSRVLTLKDNFLTGGELAQSLRIPRSFGCNQFKIGRLPSFLLGMQPHTIRIYPKSAIEELLTSEQ